MRGWGEESWRVVPGEVLPAGLGGQCQLCTLPITHACRVRVEPGYGPHAIETIYVCRAHYDARKSRRGWRASLDRYVDAWAREIYAGGPPRLWTIESYRKVKGAVAPNLEDGSRGFLPTPHAVVDP